MTMKVLGFIPARSGSKGVLDKNIRTIKKVPLLEFSVYAAVHAKNLGILDDVVVSTDSEHYLSLVNHYAIEKIICGRGHWQQTAHLLLMPFLMF